MNILRSMDPLIIVAIGGAVAVGIGAMIGVIAHVPVQVVRWLASFGFATPEKIAREMTLWGWLEKRRGGDSSVRRTSKENSAALYRDAATGADR